MTDSRPTRTMGIWAMALVAVAFGLLTIKSGGAVLFVDGQARVNAGDYVPFVLWFNFATGFLYITAGVGIFLQKRWAAWLAILLVIAILAVFGALGVHILNGGAYETRTLGAMTVRTLVLGIIALFAHRKILRR